MEETKKQFQFYLYNKPTLVVVDWFNIWNKNRDLDLKLFFDYLKSYSEIYQIRFYNGLIEGKEWSHQILDDAKSIGYEVVSKKSKQIKIDIYKEGYLKKALELLNVLLSDISDKNSEIWNKLYTLHEYVEKKISKSVNDSDILDILDGVESDLKNLNIQIDDFKKEIQKPIKRPKCDFDAEIARDIILEMNKYENLILFSGDGDFASTIKHLIKDQGKRVFVIFNRGSLGLPDYCENDLVKMVEKTNKKSKKYFDPKSTNKDNFIFIDFSKIEKGIKQQLPEDFSSGRPDMYNISDTDSKVKLE